MKIRKHLTYLHDRGATAFLLLLISADFAFIALNVITHTLPENLRNPLFIIEKDRTYPELYQYIKYFWVILLLIYLSVKYRVFQYLAWVLLFIYFLCDDSLRIHEQAGHQLSKNFNFAPLFGLGVNEVGELMISGIIGLILFPFLIWAYWSGSPEFRKVSHDIALLVAMFVFFGVVVDMAHISGNIEDGGEMLTMSLILWYVFLLMLRGNILGGFLYGIVRSIIR
ncbi:MAG: hypothetical protein ACXWTP_03695 [Methylosarcina sp.]